MTPVRGALYRALPSDATVGIAYARELQPNRWFLGLPPDGFEHAILLCESMRGKPYPIALDREFLREHGQYLSRNRASGKRDVFELVILGGRHVPLGEEQTWIQRMKQF